MGHLLSLALYSIMSLLYNLISNKGSLFALKAGDAFIQDFPLRLYLSSQGVNAIFSWLPNQFLGLPFLGLMHVGLLYPFNFLYFFLDPYIAFILNDLLHPVLTAFFTYLCARLYGASFIPAFIAGATFAFSGFVMAHRGHTSMAQAVTWFPLLIYFYERLRREMRVRYSVLAGLTLSLQILAGHLQVVVFTLIVLMIFVIFHLRSNIREKRLRFLILNALPIVTGLIIASPQLYSTYELSQHSFRLTRGYGYFTGCSLPPFMIFQPIFPFLYGGGYGGSYWGALNLTEIAGFIGIFPLAISIWTLLRLWKVNNTVRLFGIVAIFGLFLAFGRFNPFYLITYYVPVYNMFSCPATHWMEINFASCILFAIGFEYLLHDPEEVKRRREILVILFAFFALGLLLVNFGRSLSTSILIKGWSSTFVRDVFNLTNPAFYIPMSFVLLYVVLWYLIARFEKNKALKVVTMSMMTILCISELFSFGVYHQPSVGKNEVRKVLEDPLLKYLSDKATYERCLFVREDATYAVPLYILPLGIHTVNGYEPLIPLALNQLLDMGTSGLPTNWNGLLHGNLLISMLNTRYVAIHRSSYEKFKEIENLRLLERKGFKEYPLGAWELRNAERSEEGTIRLKSPDGKTVSLIEQKVQLRPNTFYLLRFEVMSHSKHPVIMDLYGGPSYDSPDQELSYTGRTKGKYINVHRIVNTGFNVPQEVKVRVFTYSSKPVQIKSVKLLEVDGIPMTKPSQSGSESKRVYERIFESEDWVLYENRNFLHRAFSVIELKTFEGIHSLKKQFETLSVNPSEKAFVSAKDLERIGQSSFERGNVEIEAYEPNRVLIRASFPSGSGFIVLSDLFYPGWKAKIDGKERAIYKVNGLLRGIPVEKGEHLVEFRYSPHKSYLLLTVSLMGFFACLFTLFLDCRKRKI